MVSIRHQIKRKRFEMMQVREVGNEGFLRKLVTNRFVKKSNIKCSKNNGFDQRKNARGSVVTEENKQAYQSVKKACIRSVQWAKPLIVNETELVKCREFDLVEICNDPERVRRLQRGHGEWSDTMIPALGLVGRVVKILPNNDIKVEICGMVFTFHPELIMGIVNSSKDKKFPILKELNEEFVRAASDGNFEKCEYILKHTKVDVNCLYSGQTALHAACWNGHLNVIRLLVKANADIEKEDNDGNRAIHHGASGTKPREVVELLYNLNSHQLEINSRNKKRQSALHIAVNKGSLPLVRLLIKLSANLNLQDMEGDTAIHDAISKNNETITTLLINAHADLEISNNCGFNPIQHATMRGSIKIMELLLNRVKQTKNYWLLNEKKDDGYTALHLACLNGYTEIARMLIDSGHIDINAKIFNQKTPLHLIVTKLNYDLTELMLQQEAVNVNFQDNNGDTPLHILIRNYSTVIQHQHQAKIIMQKNQKYPSQEITSSESAENDLHLRIAKLLIDHGASLSLNNKQLNTPLDLCSDATTVNFLNKYYSDVNQYKVSQEDEEHCLTMLESEIESNDKCSKCSTNKPEIIFKPCNHVVFCQECSGECQKCPLCNEDIKSREQIEDCIVCGEKPCSVLVEPCGHVSTCDSCSILVKKCIKCRTPISNKRDLADFYSKRYKSSINIRSKSTIIKTCQDVFQLEQQLKHIKEKTTCPVCFDKAKNMVFMCGHSTCQMCGDKISDCPICRQSIQRRIIIY